MTREQFTCLAAHAARYEPARAAATIVSLARMFEVLNETPDNGEALPEGEQGRKRGSGQGIRSTGASLP